MDLQTVQDFWSGSIKSSAPLSSTVMVAQMY